jgi:hypothetical protein
MLIQVSESGIHRRPLSRRDLTDLTKSQAQGFKGPEGLLVNTTNLYICVLHESSDDFKLRLSLSRNIVVLSDLS